MSQAVPPSSTRPRPPHLLIFNPDQWRGDVLGHMGNAAALTPTLDRLVATEAVSFRNAFCQNPICTPSRCSFMTGWYPHVRGHRTLQHMLQADEPCLLKVLKDAGYFVWWGGKNDLVRGQASFDPYCHVKFRPTPADFARWGHKPVLNLHGTTSVWRGASDSDNYFSFYAGRTSTGEDSLYFDPDWANVYGAVDMIRSAPADQPLCLYLPLGCPHPPYGVEDPWFSAINRSALPPRIPTPPGWKGKPSLLSGIAAGQNLQGWSEERWAELRATYYGMCARVDAQLGMVVEALREKGMWDDTAFFFFSDHGDFTGDYGLVEKTQNTFEDCLTRVPLVIKPPTSVGTKPRITDALAELVDFPATVYELTGVQPGYNHFGRSLLPVLTGQTEEYRDAVFCEGGRLPGEMHACEGVELGPECLYYPRLRVQRQDEVAHGKAIMCRTQRYKYVRRLYEQDELYDLQADPQELHNRIDDPALASVCRSMRDRLLQHYLETCDVVPHSRDHR